MEDDSIVRIAVVVLKLPDGRLVFQRRDKEAPTSAGLLGLFGGHIEKGETPEVAVKRELGEETSIDISGLEFSSLGNKMIRYPNRSKDDVRRFFYFQISVDNADFEVFEGDRSEVYFKEEALKRSDLTQSTQYALKELLQDG